MADVDTSIYQTLKPVQIQTPDYMHQAGQMMQLGSMGMQQMAAMRQMQTQMAMRQALASNVNPQTGQIDQQSALAQVAKTAPYALPDMQDRFTKMNQQQAQAQQAKAEAIQKALPYAAQQLNWLAGQSEEDRAKNAPAVLKDVESAGLHMPNVMRDAAGNPLYDPAQFQSALKNVNQAYANQQAQAEIAAKQSEAAKNNAEMLKTGATELVQFKDDILNASSRKETGMLMQTRDRADRLISLANTGAAPNETQDQRIARLNNTLPQLANEYSVGLASILQGGVPSDTLMKETGLGTIDSKIAELKQKWSANPTAGNQGALINAYVEAAKQMRDFSAGRLADVAKRARAAYPYANKYFGDRMDQIASPLEAPGGSQVSSVAGAQRPNGGGGGFNLVPSANAGTMPPLPKGMIRIKGPDGKTYRIPEAQKGEAIAAGGSVVK